MGEDQAEQTCAYCDAPIAISLDGLALCSHHLGAVTKLSGGLDRLQRLGAERRLGMVEFACKAGLRTKNFQTPVFPAKLPRRGPKALLPEAHLSPS